MGSNGQIWIHNHPTATTHPSIESRKRIGFKSAKIHLRHLVGGSFRKFLISLSFSFFICKTGIIKTLSVSQKCYKHWEACHLDSSLHVVDMDLSYIPSLSCWASGCLSNRLCDMTQGHNVTPIAKTNFEIYLPSRTRGQLFLDHLLSGIVHYFTPRCVCVHARARICKTSTLQKQILTRFSRSKH